MKPARILVFAKAPVPGQAKTRLVPALGAYGAARLARLMMKLTLEQALSSGAGTVELCATPDLGHAYWQGIALPPGLALSAQGEGDLGERMARAVQRCLSRQEHVLLIGTDCPGLSAWHLRAAAAALETHDAVIHPAVDGGYVLLGLRTFDASLFADIAWSSDSVAGATLQRMRRLGWRTWVGNMLPDIDEPADLIYLPPRLRAGMQAHFQGEAA